MKNIATCSHCGGTAVYADAWVGINDPDDVLGPYENFHCEDCEGECSITEVQVVEVPVETVRRFIDAAHDAADRDDRAVPAWVKDLERLLVVEETVTELP